MYTRRLLTLSLLLLSSLWGVPAHSDKPLTQIHIVSQFWEGYAEHDGQGRLWQVLKAVFARGGVTVTTEILPYNRAIKAVKQGHADAWAAAYKNEQAFAIYPKWAHDYEVLSVLAKPTSFQNWQGEASLNGKRIAYLRGYSLPQYLHADFESVTVNKLSQAVKLVELDRTDFVAEAKEDLQWLLEQRSADQKPLELRELTQLGLYLGFAPTERSRQLIHIWDTQFPKLLKSGALRRIFQEAGAMDYYPTRWRQLETETH